MQKVKFMDIFRTSGPKEIADFIAIRIEENETYCIKKCRSERFAVGAIVNKGTFLHLLSGSERPIILSNEYINIEKEGEINDD